MVAENIQLEHYEVAVSSSALKQLTWQIDPVTPAESTGSYKAQSGAVLTLISKEKVIELIESGLISASGVYIIAPDVATLNALLGEVTVLNIFYTGPDIDSSGVTATITSDKNVYSYSADSINLIGSSSMILTYPTLIGQITDGTTAFLSFYTGLTTVADGLNTQAGGIDADTTGTRITTIKGTGAPIIPPVTSPIIYEINEQLVNFDFSTNMYHSLWSGLNTEGKLDRNTWSKKSQAISNLTTSENTYLIPNHSPGLEFYIRSLDGGFINQAFSESIGYDDRASEGRDDVAWRTLSLAEGVTLSMERTTNHTIMGIGSLPYPWEECNALDNGLFANYDDGIVSGISHNAYRDDGVWRAKITGTSTRTETEANGDVVEYNSVSTTVDLAITFVERKRTDVNGVVTINGNPITGVYTPPTPTGQVNIASISIGELFWDRVGDDVTFSGKVVLSTLVSNTVTAFEIPVPVATTFTSNGECGGSGLSTSGGGFAILSTAATSGVVFLGEISNTTAQTISFSATYKVL